MSAPGPGHCLVSLVREQLRFRSDDHVQALLDLAIDSYLVTTDTEGADGDPRLA